MSSITEVRIESKTVVRYDRSKRQWLAINGTVRTFPAGKVGKRQALLVALAIDHPDLFTHVRAIAAMHDDDSQVVDRLIKAAQLVTKGHVYASGRVRSQSRPDTIHTVTRESGHFSCSCECIEFEHGIRTDYAEQTCKHMLAWLLAYLSRAELNDEPIPFSGEATIYT